MKEIGFIGIGVMGKSMVRNLIKKGFTVSIYTRTKQKALDVIEEGALWCDSIAECVKQKYAVITMVGYPKDVEEVYFGEKGILQNVSEGTYVIDMTTTSPKLSKKIYQEGAKRGISTLDAPVSGSDIGAAQGTLSIMDSRITILEVQGLTLPRTNDEPEQFNRSKTNSRYCRK